MDQRLEPWSDLKQSQRPRAGWISSIREALGMSGSQLARRLGVHRSAVKRLEAREVDGTINLGSLSRAAEALGGELVYAIVPQRSWSNVVHEQARRVARNRLERVGHTMRLEDQEVSRGETAIQEQLLAQRLLSEWPRVLWDDVRVDSEKPKSAD